MLAGIRQEANCYGTPEELKATRTQEDGNPNWREELRKKGNDFMLNGEKWLKKRLDR